MSSEGKKNILNKLKESGVIKKSNHDTLYNELLEKEKEKGKEKDLLISKLENELMKRGIAH